MPVSGMAVHSIEGDLRKVLCVRYRIFMSNGRFYDVSSIPDFRGGSLVKVSSMGEFERIAYINKEHVVSIEKTIEQKTKPHEVAWQKKNEEYERTKSKKKFKDVIRLNHEAKKDTINN